MTKKLTSQDKTNLELLCAYQATKQEICDVLIIEESELITFIDAEYGLSWDKFQKKYQASGKVKLKESNFNLAKSSPQMAKFLSDKYLTNQPMQTKKTDERKKENIFNKICQELFSDKDFQKIKSPLAKSFIVYYLQCKNQSEAARRAGYSEKSVNAQASMVRARPEVAELIAKYELREAELASDEKEELINSLYEILDVHKVVATPDDILTIRIAQDSAPIAINTIRQISKMRGFDAPRKVESTFSLADILRAQEAEGVEDL